MNVETHRNMKTCVRCGRKTQFKEAFEISVEKVTEKTKIEGEEVWIAASYTPQIICRECHKELESFMRDYTIQEP